MTFSVDPSNAEAAQDWDGPGGDFWSDHADLFDAGVAGYLQPLLDAAAIDRESQVLDVGCGIGQTTRAAARLASAGSVTGVDLSARMLQLARHRAELEGLANARFWQADVQIAELGEARFDRIISRNGVMFFGDPVAAFSNLARALKPEGRIVLSVWQRAEENEWFTAFRKALAAGRDLPPPPADGPGPFSLGEPARVRSVLTAAGFGEPELVEVREPMRFGSDLAAAEAFVLGIASGMLDELDERAAAEAVAALRASLREHLGADGITYPSAMWIITATPA